MSEPATKDFFYGLFWGVAICFLCVVVTAWLVIP